MMPTPREQQAGRRSYVVVACTMTMVMAGSTILTPLFASYRKTFGFSALTLTLIFATYILTLIPSLLIFGSLADAIGRRRVLLIATGAALASSLLLLLAQSTAWLFAARVVNGVAVGALSGAGSAALLELGKQAKTSALVTTAAISGGGAVGILLSGVLAQYAPFPLRLCYVVYLVLMLFVLSGVFTMVEPLTPGHRRPFHPHRPRWPARQTIPFLLGTAVCAVAYCANALFLSVLPSFFTVQLQTTNITLVATPVALFFLSLTMTQIVLHQLAAQRAAVIGLLLEAIGLGLMLYATALGSVPLLLVAILVGGCRSWFSDSGVPVPGESSHCPPRARRRVWDLLRLALPLPGSRRGRGWGACQSPRVDCGRALDHQQHHGPVPDHRGSTPAQTACTSIWYSLKGSLFRRTPLFAVTTPSERG